MGLALTLILGAGNAVAQGSLASTPGGTIAASEVDARLAARFPTTIAIRLGALIDSASIEGLPTEPLVLRALEGAAKGARPDMIHSAVRRFKLALGDAVRELGREVSVTELSTAAAAIQHGLNPGRLHELRRMRGHRSLTVPLATMLDLMAEGVNIDRAWQAVSSLARRQVSDRDYGKLKAADLRRPSEE